MSFNFMAAIIICSDFGAPKNKVSHCFLSICHEVMGPDVMILFTIVKTISRQLQLVGYNASLDLIWVQKAEVGLTEVS